jgi:hypothetical protein
MLAASFIKCPAMTQRSPLVRSPIVSVYRSDCPETYDVDLSRERWRSARPSRVVRPAATPVC